VHVERAHQYSATIEQVFGVHAAAGVDEIALDLLGRVEALIGVEPMVRTVAGDDMFWA